MAQWQRVGFQTRRLGVRFPLGSCFIQVGICESGIYVRIYYLEFDSVWGQVFYTWGTVRMWDNVVITAVEWRGQPVLPIPA